MTAVQWLIQQYFTSGDPLNYGHLQKALELEKEQHQQTAIHFFPTSLKKVDFEQYYTQTFTKK